MGEIFRDFYRRLVSASVRARCSSGGFADSGTALPETVLPHPVAPRRLLTLHLQHPFAFGPHPVHAVAVRVEPRGQVTRALPQYLVLAEAVRIELLGNDLPLRVFEHDRALAAVDQRDDLRRLVTPQQQLRELVRVDAVTQPGERPVKRFEQLLSTPHCRLSL